MNKKVIKTNKIDDVRRVLQDIGDKTSQMFEDTKDLKVCQTSIKAYSAAINAAKTQIIYKKLTGKPSKMSFLE